MFCGLSEAMKKTEPYVNTNNDNNTHGVIIINITSFMYSITKPH